MTRLIHFCLILIFASAWAAEPAKTYEGEVAGIFCSACSSHVKAAMMKIEGVHSVKILSSKAGGLPRLQILSEKPLTLQQATQALGDQAKIYNIRSLNLVKG